MRLREVDDRHYVVYGQEDTAFGPTPSRRLPVEAKRFWLRYGADTAAWAVVATHDGVLVGFFRYSISDDGVLYAAGTWVASRFRRKGLATRMWKSALKRHRVLLVDVSTRTHAGTGLVRSLRENGLIEEV